MTQSVRSSSKKQGIPGAVNAFPIGRTEEFASSESAILFTFHRVN